jgi:hypothetical protein
MQVLRRVDEFESAWEKIEGLLGVDSPDVVLREKLRQAVELYLAAPQLSGALYLDPADEHPVSAVAVRACARTLGEVASGAAKLGAQFVLPRTREGRLVRALVRRLMHDQPTIAEDPAPGPLQPKEAAVLGARARHFKCHDRRGPEPDLAFIELVRRLARIIGERLGPGADKLGWDEVFETPVGLLYEVFAIIEGQVPELPHKTPRALYLALRRARVRRGR